MIRLPALLLASVLAVTPTVDVVCRAVCSRATTGVVVPSCHEVHSVAATDGLLLPATSCRHDAVTMTPPTEGTRSLPARTPLVTVEITSFLHVSSSISACIGRQAGRPRATHAYPSTIVLRI